MSYIRKGVAALAGVGAVAAVGQHLASAPSRVHPLLQAYAASARAVSTAGSPKAHSLSHLGTQGSPAAAVLEDPQWPGEWPFTAEDFKRYDEGSDIGFYAAPRLVHHIDEAARAALTAFYAQVFGDGGGAAVLDICSSWVCHYPPRSSWTPSRIEGMGMNEIELAKNEQLDSYTVNDLNVDSNFPAADGAFDVVTCVVSIDYLTKPREVLAEIWRVLKPGGRVVFSQSNRCFPGKVIGIWHRTSDLEHLYIIGAYIHYNGGFTPPEALDITPNHKTGDPMYIVTATKSTAPNVCTADGGGGGGDGGGGGGATPNL